MWCWWLAIVAGLCATALGSGVVGEEYNYRETVSVWFRSIWMLQPRGDLMAAAPLYFQVHVMIGLALFACGRSPGWCTRSAHRSAICSGPTSSTAAATSRPRTIWWGRRRSAGVGDDEFVAPRECSWRRVKRGGFIRAVQLPWIWRLSCRVDTRTRSRCGRSCSTGCVGRPAEAGGAGSPALDDRRRMARSATRRS